MNCTGLASLMAYLGQASTRRVGRMGVIIASKGVLDHRHLRIFSSCVRVAPVSPRNLLPIMVPVVWIQVASDADRAHAE